MFLLSLFLVQTAKFTFSWDLEYNKTSYNERKTIYRTTYYCKGTKLRFIQLSYQVNLMITNQGNCNYVI